MERTITNLSKLKGRVYVYLANADIGKSFMSHAKAEGFKLGKADPTTKEPAEIMAVNLNKTINYVGSIGSAAFHSNLDTIGGEPLIRVDYGKFVSGEDEYMISK